MAAFRRTLAFFALAMLSGSTLALPERRDPQITETPVLKPHSCFSYTVTTPYTGVIHCPIQTQCGPEPDCIILSKTTLEVPCANSKCPKTPTVTVTGPGVCPTCRTGCGVDLVTETMTTGCPSVTPY
ncbi:uncharacterized protein PAC_08993 [Phialocephala subalpina]|uniref:Uncharacterized protein n=1 Tax=Phialocephala subalpina TaxID=576137 RepID=A0A1L7X256_9HELO|nr:uncharacterized protein PAC_08993 [Phialocephala subalpina]